MFCPRCGRFVSDTANFCGGCGLPKSEINKIVNSTVPQPAAAPVITPGPDVNTTPVIPTVNIDEIHSEIEKLEKDLSGVSPVNDYTTDILPDTNSISPVDEKPNANNDETVIPQAQSDYSYYAPKSPMYSRPEKEYTNTTSSAYNTERPVPMTNNNNQTLSTVDFIWMMLISSLPVVGMIYLIWLGFIQKENVNKQSYARATLIIALFASLLIFVFAMGLIITQIGMFY